mmetsp:Transcript_10800/g.20911  ORF Transcript_10800/g.20911 Transcript_10800/m.20911 type:complete len:158 (-) Transcript_10800:1888-2361(-)
MKGDSRHTAQPLHLQIGAFFVPFLSFSRQSGSQEASRKAFIISTCPPHLDQCSHICTPHVCKSLTDRCHRSDMERGRQRQRHATGYLPSCSCRRGHCAAQRDKTKHHRQTDRQTDKTDHARTCTQTQTSMKRRLLPSSRFDVNSPHFTDCTINKHAD